jgi:uncharacterized protein
MIVLDEQHLRAVLIEFLACRRQSRSHAPGLADPAALSLARAAPRLRVLRLSPVGVLPSLRCSSIRHSCGCAILYSLDRPTMRDWAWALRLTGYNVLLGALPAELYRRLYVPCNLIASGALLYWALTGRHFSRADLGLRVSTRRSVALGVSLGLAVGAPSAMALLLVGDTARYSSAAVSARSLTELVRQVCVRIPLGTVLIEEFAFRGLGPAILRTQGHTRTGAAIGSGAFFALWHLGLVPRALREPNSTRSSALLGSLAMVPLAFIAGVLLTVLRFRTASLVTPSIVHWLINSLASVALFMRRRDARPGGIDVTNANVADALASLKSQVQRSLGEHKRSMLIDSWFYNGGTVAIVIATTLATLVPSIAPAYVIVGQILTGLATILVALQRTLGAAERYTFHRQMLAGYRVIDDYITEYPLVLATDQPALLVQIRQDLLALRRREAGLPGVGAATPGT